MIVILAKEEGDIKKDRARNISMVKNSTNNGQKWKFNSNTSNNHKTHKIKIMNTKGNGKNDGNKVNMISSSSGCKYKGFKGKCNFCHKTRHKKEDCWKLKAKKKGNCIVLVCLESNIIDVPSNTSRLDIGAIITLPIHFKR